MNLVKECEKKIREEIRRVQMRKKKQKKHLTQKQRYLRKVNYQESIWQKSCLGGTMRSLKMSI